MNWKSNHWSKIDWEMGHGHVVAISSLWLLLRYGVPHGPWKKGKAGDNRCFSKKVGKQKGVIVITIQTWRCYSNFEKKKRSIVKNNILQ